MQGQCTLKHSGSHLDGRDVLKVPVRMLNNDLRLRPIRRGVDSYLIKLVCGEEFGAVRGVEIGLIMK